MHRPIPRRTMLTAAAFTLLVTATVPVAFARAGGLAQVDVYDRSAGEALPTYRHHGRRYVEGRTGNEYAVRIRNCTGQRLLAVLSVDGVNAVTGETASPDQSGYVIEPWGYVTVQGWRKSLDHTAAFYFTDPQDAYASRTGRPADVGVIGVALFRERQVEPRYGLSDREADRSDAGATAREKANASPAAEAQGRAADSAVAAQAAPAPSLGTGHGRGEYSPVQTVAFERARSRPDELLTIRYETRETLVSLGVLPPSRVGWQREPEPFPGVLGFVPDP